MASKNIPEAFRGDLQSFRDLITDPVWERMNDSARVCFMLHRLQQTIERASAPHYETKEQT